MDASAVFYKKRTAVFLVLVISAYSFSELVLYKQRENIVDSAQPSYHFRYAGGFSSIDLRPYDLTNEDHILAVLQKSAAFRVNDPLEMPVMEGAEAAYPVYSAFANACYVKEPLNKSLGASRRHIFRLSLPQNLEIHKVQRARRRRDAGHRLGRQADNAAGVICDFWALTVDCARRRVHRPTAA